MTICPRIHKFCPWLFLILKIHIGWNKQLARQALVERKVLWCWPMAHPSPRTCRWHRVRRKRLPPRSGNKMGESEVNIPADLQASVRRGAVLHLTPRGLFPQGAVRHNNSSPHQLPPTSWPRIACSLCVWKRRLEQMAGLSARAEMKLVVSPEELPALTTTKVLATNT